MFLYSSKISTPVEIDPIGSMAILEEEEEQVTSPQLRESQVRSRMAAKMTMKNFFSSILILIDYSI
jgi:hypothetical protein